MPARLSLAGTRYCREELPRAVFCFLFAKHPCEATDLFFAPETFQPAIKATFDITLRVPSDLVALSNMNVISEKDIGQSGKVKGDSTKGPDGEPSTQKGDVPSIQKGDVPSTQKGDVPSTQKGDVPSTQKGDVPSTQKGDVPSAQKGDVPSTQKGDAVTGYTGSRKEVKFATTPVMSTYVRPFFCPLDLGSALQSQTNSNLWPSFLVGCFHCRKV